ncbi:8-oxo-dGTP diphosphatase MutT [Pseudoalteromonas sp. T1lg76]|uniref:8-oxo-dGTP diphosphatase MutT n=1 Tax=Pseudoalteromonas sp. T1lg76 TaxID=2077103 RepID=UPI000CF657E6|nr:8-oxo-dGTP diphosphatase MutT [Pseudoalteromonas sp. T1lg76]
MSQKVVNVAVGIILRGAQTYICKRPDDKHQGGLWEFPGGKIEAGETTTAALARELLEEVAIEVHSSDSFMLIEHDYGDKQVRLDIHKVSDFSGEPHGAEGQQGEWVALNDLHRYAFPKANQAILEKLCS